MKKEALILQWDDNRTSDFGQALLHLADGIFMLDAEIKTHIYLAFFQTLNPAQGNSGVSQSISIYVTEALLAKHSHSILLSKILIPVMVGAVCGVLVACLLYYFKPWNKHQWHLNDNITLAYKLMSALHLQDEHKIGKTLMQSNVKLLLAWSYSCSLLQTTSIEACHSLPHAAYQVVQDSFKFNEAPCFATCLFSTRSIGIT